MKSYKQFTATLPSAESNVQRIQKQLDAIAESLAPDASAGEYVKDFQKSDAPQFEGKSKEKRRQMALAAYMASKRNK